MSIATAASGCTQQPQWAPRLMPRYRTVQTPLVFVPTNGLQSGDGSALTMPIVNGAYTGPRFLAGQKGRAMRMYADQAGNDDDVLQWSLTVSNAKAQAYTTILAYRSDRAIDAFQRLMMASCHMIEVRFTDDALNAGYDAANGYARIARFNTANLDGMDSCVVISTRPGSPSSVAFNGRSPDSWTGLDAYVGDGGGTRAATNQPRLEPSFGYTNYYGFNGLVYFWSEVPGLYVDQSEAQRITTNPWQVLAAAR